MAWFQNMGDAEKFRIVSLPFRVGLWMSLADDVPGGQDDRDELEALERILRVIAKTHDQTPFLQATVHVTLKYNKLWKKWQGYNENTLRDTHVALRELLKRRGAEDMKVYRIMLYKIAEAVAAAYNENAYDPDKIILNAVVTRSAVAPPPTSRKFAGSPPLSLMMSIVAIAKPAPFTIQPMLPSRRT